MFLNKDVTFDFARGFMLVEGSSSASQWEVGATAEAVVAGDGPDEDSPDPIQGWADSKESPDPLQGWASFDDEESPDPLQCWASPDYLQGWAIFNDEEIPDPLQGWASSDDEESPDPLGWASSNGADTGPAGNASRRCAPRRSCHARHTRRGRSARTRRHTSTPSKRQLSTNQYGLA
jgi:hypothetical protein